VKSDIPTFPKSGFYLIEKLKEIKQLYASLDRYPDVCAVAAAGFIACQDLIDVL